ncbi:Sodium/glucose cotransporter [Planctomycetes bacterium Pan216]|uniref:Sodium/glucose cotransporter n=1 Tax=Kolteria novifilia TaxID=2527975 RepID=A0A518B095_9BACT|nr:Sodium/glucose cotransporter [Planctomycetes bacterium Pan216]
MVCGRVITLLLICASAPSDAPRESSAVGNPYSWGELDAFPNTVGVAGPFAGVTGDALLVAGGANFPDGRPWDGYRKVWHDDIYLLERPDGSWKRLEQTLPKPLAYGLSLTTPEGVICIGGGDADEHVTDVRRYRWDGTRLVVEELPPLPIPLAFASGAILDGVIYVAGGLTKPNANKPEHRFLAFDLREGTWRELEPWPGPPRMLAAMGAQAGAIILGSGVDLVAGRDGSPVREYLTDAFRYRPGDGWSPIAPLPQPAVASPNPAPAIGQTHLLVLGGDTGAHAARVEELADRHPGFSQDILAFETVTNSWRTIGSLPRDPSRNIAPPVTTPAVMWNGRLVLPSGEVRPGVRSSIIHVATPLRRTRFGFWDYFSLCLYLLAIVGVGVYFSRREHSTEDFFLAGRRIPWWAAGLSIFGTQLSAITFMAVPAKAYAEDWTFALLNGGILLVAPLVVWFYLPHFRRQNVTTAYEYLEQRFSVGVRWAAGGTFTLMQLGRMGVVLYLPALALSAAIGLNVWLSIIVMGVLATIYTYLGGIEAVVWTDVLQVFVLLGGALLALLLIAFDVGGPFALVADAQQSEKLRLVHWTTSDAGTAFWIVAIAAFFNPLIPYTSDQAVVQRYLTTPTESAAARSIWTNAVLTIPATILFFGLGTALYVYYSKFPSELNPHLPIDAMLPWFIVQRMPTGIAGLVIAAVFAASMSTLDSSLNSVATVITTDFVRRRYPERDELFYLNLARGLTLLLGVLGTGAALWMASSHVASLFDMFQLVLGFAGGGLAGLFVLAIFTRRSNARGALIGWAASFAVVATLAMTTQLSFLLFGAIGVTVSVLVGFCASLMLTR